MLASLKFAWCREIKEEKQSLKKWKENFKKYE